jgi:hypothetical protein
MFIYTFIGRYDKKNRRREAYDKGTGAFSNSMKMKTRHVATSVVFLVEQVYLLTCDKRRLKRTGRNS